MKILLLGLIVSVGVAAPKHGKRLAPGITESKSPIKQKKGHEVVPHQEAHPSSASNPSSTSPSLESRPGELKRCEAKYPVETFVQISSSTRPQPSLKGGVYFLSDLRDTSQVFYLDRPKAWPKQISFFPDGVKYFRLSPNSKRMLIATDVGGDEQYDLYLLELEGRVTTHPLLVGRTKRVESVAWANNSNQFAFTSNERNRTDFDLYWYDVSLRKSTLLSGLEGHHTVTDVSPDGKRILITRFRSVLDSEILIYEKETKLLKPLYPPGAPTSDEQGLFSSNGKGILFLSDQVGGIKQLRWIGMKGAKPEQKELTQEGWDLESISMDTSRSALVYTVNDQGYGRIGGFELDAFGKKKGALEVPRIPKALLSDPALGNWSQKKNLFFTRTSAVENNNIWEHQAGALTQWTASTQAQIDSFCLATETKIDFVSFDGKKIPAFLFRPKNTAGPIPFIVYVHGGPESQYRPSFSRIFQYFVQRGFGVLAPNVRGSTGYGREYTGLDNYKKRMDSVSDVIAGAKWLLENKYSSPGKLAIYGGSYGGFLVLRSIQVEPALFAAAAESVGIANFVTFLKNTKPYRRALREVEYGPLSDEEFLKSISPTSYLDEIKTPLLIFHGANDPRVPVSETEQIVEELKNRDIDVQYKIFENEGHGNARTSNTMEQAKQMVYFFEKHLAEKKEN